MDTYGEKTICQSRICGPVVDEEEQVKQSFPNVSFIHMEIYNENNPAKGVRPQVETYDLPSEPWTFVIDKHGIIRSRFEGALSVEEMEQAVKEVAS